MTDQNYINILDFGSSKIRFSIYDSSLNKIFSDNRNLSQLKDEINKVEEMDKLIKNAEKKISKHIDDIILTLDSPQLFTIDLSLKKNFDSRKSIIKIYNSLILEVNQIIEIYYKDLEIVHIILCQCIIDDKIYFELPKEKKEFKNIKIDFKLICFPKLLVSNIKNIFKKINVNVTNIFCTSYVKSSSYIKKLNKKNASFIDVGFEKTSLVVFKKNKLKLIQSIPIGGSNITKDISTIFNIRLDEAEKIKRSFNRTETEFSYNNENHKNSSVINEILNKNISIDLLKKVILYRVQEIIDLSFKRAKAKNPNLDLNNFDLFFIGEGSQLFNENSFYLKDKFQFKTLNFYKETESSIINSILVYYQNNHEKPYRDTKKIGLFEKFFNYFSK